MRTETDLREVFATLADTAPDPVRFADRLQYGRARTPRRTPRRLVLVVAIAGLALVAALIPYVLFQQSAEPADRRAPGYWGFVSRVDAPAGWVVGQRGIEDTREYTLLGPDQDRSRVCEVTVFGRGDHGGSEPVGEALTVGGRSAVYTTGTVFDPARLLWRYADDAWVVIACDSASAEESRRWSAELLGRVSFVPTPARLPFRLSGLPAGYTVQNLVATTSDSGSPVGGVTLSSERGSITVVNTAYPLDAPAPGRPEPEELTVDGHPAVYRQDQQALTVAVGDQTVGVYEGNRADLLDLGRQLEIASDLADPRTWYDARRALP